MCVVVVNWNHQIQKKYYKRRLGTIHVKEGGGDKAAAIPTEIRRKV
jgi:hypothetical protein